MGIQEGSTMEIENSTFTGNTGYDGGGAVAAMFVSSVSVDSCTFEDNTTGYVGGAFFASSEEEGAVVTITGSDFTSNISTWMGGGVYAGPTLSVSSTTFTANEALWGAGLYFPGSGDLSLEDLDFVDNDAFYNGGGLAVEEDESPVVDMSSSTLSGNQSGAEGGGAWFTLTSTLVCDDVDWSTGSSDNTPDDMAGWGSTWAGLGSGETFTCTPGSCNP